MLGPLWQSALLCRAQTPATPTFRTQSELVLVPIVVTRNGRHVSGLTPDKFTILEDGTQQQLVSVEEIKSDDRPVAGQAARAPNTFSNLVEEQRVAAHLTIFAFDTINTSAIVQSHARESLMRFLLALPESDSPMMLVALTSSGLRVLHSMTTSPAELRTAIARMKTILSEAERSGDTTREDQQARDAAMQAVSARNQGKPERDTDEIARLAQLFVDLPDSFKQSRTIERARTTLEQLQDLARALAGVPGRKSLVWVTGGISFTEGTSPELPFYNVRSGPRSRSTSGVPFGMIAEANDQFDRTWELFSDGNIAVYPVDMQQLFNPCFSDPGISGMRCGEHDKAQMGFGLRAQAMNGFPDKTGGKYCNLQQNLEECFRSAAEQSAQYYMAAFHPKSREKAGWRKLTIRVAAPDVHVSTRSGYFLRRNNAPAAQEGEWNSVLASRLDATGIAFSVRWLEAREGESKPGRTMFEIVLAPGAITLENENRFHITLAGVAYNGKGEAASRLYKKIEAQPRSQEVEQISKTGLHYRDAVELAPGEREVRFIVRDEYSGRIGSVTAYRE